MPGTCTAHLWQSVQPGRARHCVIIARCSQWWWRHEHIGPLSTGCCTFKYHGHRDSCFAALVCVPACVEPPDARCGLPYGAGAIRIFLRLVIDAFTPGADEVFKVHFRRKGLHDARDVALWYVD